MADYCDIMRCEVLITHDSSLVFGSSIQTDIEVWSESTAYRTAVSTSGPRDLAKLSPRSTVFMAATSSSSTTSSSPKVAPKQNHNNNNFNSNNPRGKVELNSGSGGSSKCDKSAGGNRKNFTKKDNQDGSEEEEDGEFSLECLAICCRTEM